MSRKLACVGFISLSILATTPVFALRCGTTLIQKGDSISQVEARCGEPSYTQQRTVYRTLSASAYSDSVSPHNGERQILEQDRYTYSRNGVSAEGTVVEEILVDVWEYNFGPRRLLQKIVFEDGEVVRIKSQGYGH